MAKTLRTEAEQEADRLWLMGLIQTGGADFSPIRAWELLNNRRGELARRAALAAGQSPEAAESAADDACLTVQSVRRDIRIVLARVRAAAEARAAVFLDDQLRSCQLEIEATFERDDEILSDLERSRRTRWTKTRGVAPGGGAPAAPVPVEIVSYREDEAPGLAALYGRLAENSRLRMALRGEMRLLYFGRRGLAVEDDQAPTVGVATFAQLVTRLSDPEKARDAAMQLFARELASLVSSESMPVPAELAALERMRVQRSESRVRLLREFVRATAPGDTEDGRTFEVHFERAGEDPS